MAKLAIKSTHSIHTVISVPRRHLGPYPQLARTPPRVVLTPPTKALRALVLESDSNQPAYLRRVSRPYYLLRMRAQISRAKNEVIHRIRRWAQRAESPHVAVG